MSAVHSPQFELIVEKFLSGIRIDSFLVKHFRNYESWQMQRIVAAGGVRVNSAAALQTDRVFRGQTIQVRLIEPPNKLFDPEQIPLNLLYEDPWIMVVNKPADLTVHPVGSTDSGTLANGIQHLLDQRTQCKGLLRPGIVHRLDRQTSGAIVVALTHNAHSQLSSAFESSQVSKSYLALVEGIVKKDRGMIDRPIGRANSGRHVLMTCRPDAANAKRSKTLYRVIERFREHSLVLARPLTGRNHQIRVHFAHLGHPLVGDEFYKKGGKFHPFHERGATREVETGFPIRRHALHAVCLEFAHPITNVWLTLQAGLPEDFQDTITTLRMQKADDAKV